MWAEIVSLSMIRLFTIVILKMGHKQSQDDHMLLVKYFPLRRVTTLIVYVNDIIVMGDDDTKEIS